MDIQKIFLKSNRVQVVRELEQRLAQLHEALEWIDCSEEAAPIEEEARIIQATLRAIRAEHAPGFFAARRDDEDEPDADRYAPDDAKSELIARFGSAVSFVSAD